MHKRLVSRLLLATSVLLLLSGCSRSDKAEQAPEAALDSALEKSFKQSGAPGVIAAVQTPRFKWVRALGVADLTSGKAITPDMHHRIASVTKTFTITLLLQLASEGRLSLGDTIDHYIKGIPNGDRITLRQLANMTSGIASYEEHEGWADGIAADPKRAWKPEELVRVGIQDSPLFDPGTESRYSNTNTVLLGLVLEHVTGEPVGRLYRERIIDPLGLKHTSFPDVTDSSIPDPHPRGYTLTTQSGGQPVDATDWSPSQAWVAGAMISTAEDLLVYGRALGTGKGLLLPEQQAERLNSFIANPRFPVRSYGLGLASSRGWVGHTGSIPGFNTVLFYHPELEAVVVVEVNDDYMAGDCPPKLKTPTTAPRGIPCETPEDRILAALTEALGKPFPPYVASQTLKKDPPIQSTVDE